MSTLTHLLATVPPDRYSDGVSEWDLMDTVIVRYGDAQELFTRVDGSERQTADDIAEMLLTAIRRKRERDVQRPR